MIQKPKGTYDIYGKKSEKILYLKKLIVSLMDKYNVKYIQTPTFENSEVFHRTVGEGSDIVKKETYDFVDRGGRNMTLRPEGTAGIARSVIENKLYIDSAPIKLWYFGSMFRYERPQAGRNRELTQFGVEFFGSDDASVDAEVISIMVNLFKLLGLNKIKVNLNTLGDSSSREDYKKALLEYFNSHLNELCDDCKKRYENNPLRILDCKVDRQLDIMKNAPKIKDYLNKDSITHYNMVKEYLKQMDIDFTEDDNLVRGLDYYTHTVFEIEVENDKLGVGNVLGAGGRYNNLVETLGGPKTSGVGFAVGIDRLLIALEDEQIDDFCSEKLDIYAFCLSENEKIPLVKITNYLRINGFNVEMDYNNRNIKNNFKHADNLKVNFVLMIGEKEVQEGIVTIKNNYTKEEYKVKTDELIEFLDRVMTDESK